MLYYDEFGNYSFKHFCRNSQEVKLAVPCIYYIGPGTRRINISIEFEIPPKFGVL